MNRVTAQQTGDHSNLKTILIVEDDSSLATILKDKLARHNFTILTANNGNAALLKTIKYKPDLILLDLLLPHMNGLEVLKIIRKRSWGKKLPVIVLTNVDDIESLNESVKNGVQCHYIKANTSLDTVVQTVRKQLA